jgi:hypothetical protein
MIPLLLMEQPFVSLDRRHSVRFSSQPVILFMAKIPLFGGTSTQVKRTKKSRKWFPKFNGFGC